MFMGPGMVIDVEHLYGEVEKLREAGINITPDNLKISDRAVICMPYHKMLDCLEEDRLGDANSVQQDAELLRFMLTVL